MGTFIVELGSGNTCRNNVDRLKRMIQRVMDMDTGRYHLLFKVQLFDKVGGNVPLSRRVFDVAYFYAMERGYSLSASVFSAEWLDYLLEYDPEWVKIACLPELHKLISAVPSAVGVFASFPTTPGPLPFNVTPLACVREYPATVKQYERAFKPSDLRIGISDHTVGWELIDKYEPEVFEKHVVDVREDGNPDAGPFAVTIDELEGRI